MTDTGTKATDLLDIIREAVAAGRSVTITADEITLTQAESTWSNPSITIE